MYNMSVIWQKGESQNGGNKNTNHAKFPKNERFLPSDTDTYAHAPVIKPTKKAFEKHKSRGLLSRFYGALCQVNRSLVLCYVTLNSYSQAQVDQVRNS